MSPARGKAYIVGAGPGDPGLITVKGLEAIQRADVIIYDRLMNPYLLSHAPAGAEWVYAGKSASGRVMEQVEIERLLVEKTRQGKIVVRLKGGDPMVFGRGGEEAEALAEQGLDFEIVPGISSAVAAPAYAGIPLTHRARSSSFAVVTGREDPSKEWPHVPWDKLIGGVGTLTVLMGAESLPRVVERLVEGGLAVEMPVAAIQWGTDPRQRTVVGTIQNIVELVEAAEIGAPSVLVVGEVVRLRDRLRWFDKKPLFGKRVLVTRSRDQASALSRLLEEAGAEPVELPVIDIRPPKDWGPLDAALGKLSEYDWAIFTSVNPVRMVWDRLRVAGLDARAFSGVSLCAVGAATAQALRGHGLEPDFVPERYTGEDMVKGLGEEALRGRRVLLPRTDIAPQELVGELESAGARVDQVVAYRTATPVKSRKKVKELLTRGQVDIVTFSSSSTVQNLVRLMGDDAPSMLGGLTIACIGPVTARAAEKNGLNVAITAKEHTIPGLVSSIVEAFSTDKEGG